MFVTVTIDSEGTTESQVNNSFRDHVKTNPESPVHLVRNSRTPTSSPDSHGRVYGVLQYVHPVKNKEVHRMSFGSSPSTLDSSIHPRTQVPVDYTASVTLTVTTLLGDPGNTTYDSNLH